MSTRGDVGVFVSLKAIAFAEILNALAVFEFVELLPTDEEVEVVGALLVLDTEVELGKLIESPDVDVGVTTAAAWLFDSSDGDGAVSACTAAISAGPPSLFTLLLSELPAVPVAVASSL